ncbi:NADP oxidoreductase [Pseudooceanicola sediminis]|uniref:Pyrroline-5-carboxylate reductase n=1 Tax=Pseudooceanicola sediminis TaxID=2211117 RepID=A0A399J1M7_9RHOB|nr:pyrroline-5-carboxylate reductase dimerization domain-containing protein [Pseudooceanicola sediminis]KAA2316280.1 NADP oxidoreductase [Puniceibacterium sp. HSS470]RII39190.1 NADP oxidoreductase [Pseudooceanicola sediminis]|tara:strand:- start:48996 stop:49811 length:816 start_codon:yes stop_codon:yes gene_type:complete
MTRDRPDAARVALIGASGWLGQFIGPAMLRRGVTTPERFTAINRSGPSAAYDGLGAIPWAATLADLPTPPEVVILSLRAHDFRAGRFECPDALVISLMAGVTVGEIEARTGSARIIRALPNALAEIAQSYTPWLASAAVDAADRALCRAIFRGVGREAEVPDEAALDVLTTLSGAGPAFAALLARALVRAGQRAGLSETVAQGAAENMVCGAAHLMAGRIESAPEIVQSFVAYDGVIAAALRAAEDTGFDAAIEAAVEAGLARVHAMTAED